MEVGLRDRRESGGSKTCPIPVNTGKTLDIIEGKGVEISDLEFGQGSRYVWGRGQMARRESRRHCEVLFFKNVWPFNLFTYLSKEVLHK